MSEENQPEAVYRELQEIMGEALKVAKDLAVKSEDRR